jgi:xanthine dehydrogenase accessory factor
MTTTEDVFASARALHQGGTPYALVSVIRAQAPASARPGDKAVVTADGDLHGWIGGGCAQPVVVRAVRDALDDGRARLIRIAPSDTRSERTLDDVLEFGMSCHSGGTLELFIDPILPRARLVVIGGSPVAASLAGLAPHVGFDVVMVAAGAELAPLPHAIVLADDAPERVRPHVAPGAWVVVATQGRRDIQALRLALALEARQVSFVASARKAQVLKETLVAAGADAAAVAAIVAPAGAPIGAATPEEIALSVLAAVVSARRGIGAGGPVAAAETATREGMAREAMAREAMAREATPGEATPREATPATESTPAPMTSSPPVATSHSCCGG